MSQGGLYDEEAFDTELKVGKSQFPFLICNCVLSPCLYKKIRIVRENIHFLSFYIVSIIGLCT